MCSLASLRSASEWMWAKTFSLLPRMWYFSVSRAKLHYKWCKTRPVCSLTSQPSAKEWMWGRAISTPAQNVIILCLERNSSTTCERLFARALSLLHELPLAIQRRSEHADSHVSDQRVLWLRLSMSYLSAVWEWGRSWRGFYLFISAHYAISAALSQWHAALGHWRNAEF